MSRSDFEAALADALAGRLTKPETGQWRGHLLLLPRIRYRLLQLLIALLDWMAAAAVLYVLLPSGSVPYPVLLSAFVLSSLLGVLAHVPGGIGVFEASMSLLLTHYLPVDKLLTHEIALDELNEAFDRLASGAAVRQVIRFG